MVRVRVRFGLELGLGSGFGLGFVRVRIRASVRVRVRVRAIPATAGLPFSRAQSAPCCKAPPTCNTTALVLAFGFRTRLGLGSVFGSTLVLGLG